MINRNYTNIIVSYDISNTKIRTKISKLLSNYGTRIQLSVFEITVHYSIQQQLIKELKKIIKHKINGTDSILIIRLTNANLTQIERIGILVQELPEVNIF